MIPRALAALILLSTTCLTPLAGSQPGVSVWTFTDAHALTDLEGNRYDRENLEGRYVLLDFWATWCAPCLAELPNLERIHTTFPKDQLLLLSVSLDQGERRSLLSWLKRHDIQWPQVHDGRAMKGTLARKFGVNAVPRTVVVNPAGRVVAVDLRGSELWAVLDTLVGSE